MKAFQPPNGQASAALPPTRTTVVKTDAQLRQLGGLPSERSGGGSNRFVNRQSAQQAHDQNGAKRVAWPVEPKRSDEPIISRRSSSTAELNYHTTRRAWRVAARDFVNGRLRRTVYDSASISRQPLTSDSPRIDTPD